MDRRTILAMTLCFVIYLGWQKLYIEPRLHPESVGALPLKTPSPASSPQTQGNPVLLSQNISPQPPSKPQQKGEPQKTLEEISLLTEIGTVVLNHAGPFFQNWVLKDYKLGLSPESSAVDLQSVTHQTREISLAFDDHNFAYLNEVQGSLSKTPLGALWVYEDDQVKLTREFKTSLSVPYVDTVIHAQFKKIQQPRYAFLSLSSSAIENDPEAQDRQIVYWTQQSIERLLLKDATELKEIPTPVKYVGATNRYFILSLIAQSPMEAKGLIQPVSSGKTHASLVYPIPGNSLTLPVRVYFGPKELELLRRVEPTLDHTVDFGWFTVFAYPLLKTLRWFYQFLKNYGLAIICLTLLLKILTYPLTFKSMKSMKKMAALQPQLQRIREKHKDDREALNREMLTMMKSHGYNPMAG